MKMTNCRSSVAFFIYCGAAVLVIVNGQPTTDVDIDAYEISELRAELKKSLTRISKLEGDSAASVDKNDTQRGASSSGDVQTGASYIRWGRKTCGNNASLVYTGHAAGPRYSIAGGGGNFLCLPDNPQWKNYINGHQHTADISGIEYELFNSGRLRNNIFSENNNGGNPLLDKPAPCAVCYVGGRSTILMIPAKTQCPDGWTTQYAGYLGSEARANGHRSSYVCWDEAPEVAAGATAQNQALVYPVEVICGSLPCSIYLTGRELTCIVCSK